MFGQNTPNGAAGDFGAKYASLKPEQKALVDDWIRRFSATIQKQVDPEKAYDNLPRVNEDHLQRGDPRAAFDAVDR